MPLNKISFKAYKPKPAQKFPYLGLTQNKVNCTSIQLQTYGLRLNKQAKHNGKISLGTFCARIKKSSNFEPDALEWGAQVIDVMKILDPRNHDPEYNKTGVRHGMQLNFVNNVPQVTLGENSRQAIAQLMQAEKANRYIADNSIGRAINDILTKIYRTHFALGIRTMPTAQDLKNLRDKICQPLTVDLSPEVLTKLTAGIAIPIVQPKDKPIENFSLTALDFNFDLDHSLDLDKFYFGSELDLSDKSASMLFSFPDFSNKRPAELDLEELELKELEIDFSCNTVTKRQRLTLGD